MSGTTIEETAVGFAALGLDARLVEALRTLGYEEPTPIQREAIPPLLEGRDLIGQAATGTGKTAAFALPMLQRLAELGEDRARPAALILVPTRELAMQVGEAVHKYGRGWAPRSCRSTADRHTGHSSAAWSGASTSWSPRRAEHSTTSAAGR